MSSGTKGITIDQIIRSKRKTISLELKRDGSLIVRAPILATKNQIDELLKTKAAWIRKKREILSRQSLEAPPKQFISGEMFLYLGKSYPLTFVDNQDEPLLLNDKFYLSEISQQEGRVVFEKWYRRRASEIIESRVAERAQQNGFSYSRVRITSARTRWGSCSPKGSLNFTWRLVMAPVEVIDYVVVHELVHLKIRNHSKAYWLEVSKLLPDYKHKLTWLKENGHRLTLD